MFPQERVFKADLVFLWLILISLNLHQIVLTWVLAFLSGPFHKLAPDRTTQKL